MRGVHIPQGAAQRALARLPAPAQVADPRARLRRAPVVWRSGNLALHAYRSTVPRGRPLLIVYAHVNHPAILDLAPGHSLIGALRRAGVTVYLLDWGEPGAREAGWSLADYVLGGVGDALREVASRHRIRAPHLLGVCQGGTFALMYAALAPARVRSLTCLMTPVDFHAGAPLAAAARALACTDAPDLPGTIPGAAASAWFHLLEPLRRPARGGPGSAATRRLGALLERWLARPVDLPGRATREFVRATYGENALVRGTLALAGRRVDLAALRRPVLNLYARDDHLVPPASAAALRGLVRHAPCRELAFPGGHLSLCVSPRALREVPALIASWLRAYD